MTKYNTLNLKHNSINSIKKTVKEIKIQQLRKAYPTA